MKILLYGDSPMAPTGFGQVSEYVVPILLEFGQVKMWAINAYEPLDKARFNIDIVQDNTNPFGIEQFKKMILEEDYDILMIINNHEFALIFEPEIKQVKEKRNIKYIHYAPIDTSFETYTQKAYKLIPDVRVYYNEYSKTLLDDKGGKIINHGSLPEIFKPLNQKQELRKKWGYTNDDFIFINVNHNQWRKDLYRTIAAFCLMQRHAKNAKLLLHCNVKDMGGDLREIIQHICEQYNVDLKDKVQITDINRFRFSREELNELYNIADCFISTSLGEGWGLTTTEALCAGLPVIVPDNTSFWEIVHHQSMVYPMKEWIVPYKDSTIPYPIGRVETIALRMKAMYNGTGQTRSAFLTVANEIRRNSWENIQIQWRKLLNDILNNQDAN